MNKKLFSLIVVFAFFAKAFCGPFGIDFGMSLEQVRKVCKTAPKNLNGNVYVISPPSTNNLFEAYAVHIHPTYGVYVIKAISKEIDTNRFGTALKAHFENLVGNLEKIYGKPEVYDVLVPGSYWEKPDNFMYALLKDERILMAIWEQDEKLKLPQNFAQLGVIAKAKSESIGYLILEYYSTNKEKVDSEEKSVF